MKAAVLTDWKIIQNRDVDKPDYGPEDVLIRVSYAGVCGSDVHIYNGTNPIARTPVIQGHEFTGHLAAIGDSVHGYALGDRVAVQPLVFCGQCAACRRGTAHVCKNLVVIGVNRDGGFASYVSVPADTLFPVSDNLPETTAALAEPFSIGCHACRRGELQAGESVLVIGAGPIGLYSAMVARELGAASVLVSEPNPERRRFAESFGIASVDPNDKKAQQDLGKKTEGAGFDLVIETSGVSAGLDFASEAVAIRGRIVTLGFPAKNYASYNITRGIVKEISLIGSRVCTRDEFAETLRLLESMQQRSPDDFDRIVASPRQLDTVARSILDVEEGKECAKILIQPG